MAQATKTRGSSSTKGSSSSSSQSSRNNNNSTSQAEDAERYRRAAEDALQQLDWAIGYLHGIKKTQISKALAQNRSYIRRNLLGRSEQPLPDEQTNET
jgi:hypothetical protein